MMKWQEKLNQMLESLGEDNIMIKKSFVHDTSLEMALEVHILSCTEMQ